MAGVLNTRDWERYLLKKGHGKRRACLLPGWGGAAWALPGLKTSLRLLPEQDAADGFLARGLGAFSFARAQVLGKEQYWGNNPQISCLQGWFLMWHLSTGDR